MTNGLSIHFLSKEKCRNIKMKLNFDSRRIKIVSEIKSWVMNKKWRNMKIKGCTKKKSLNLRRSFRLISLAAYMLEGWNITHLTSEIHTSVWSTKTFLYDIREPRYSNSKWGTRFEKKYLLDNLMSHIDLLLFRLPYALQKLVWAWGMSKDVTFKMGHLPAF